jgi:hypothetical protein
MFEHDRSDLCSPSLPLANTDDRSSNASFNEIEQDCSLVFPDGGWRAWGVVLGSWCAMVPSSGLMNTIGVLEAWLADHQLKDYSKASISWIFSLYVFFIYFEAFKLVKDPFIPKLCTILTFGRTSF